MSISVTVLPGTSYKVQIVVDETPDGVPWKVTGHVVTASPGLLPGDDVIPSGDLVLVDSVLADGSWSWTVPGGHGIGDGGQIVLTDIRSPGNVSVQYRLTVGQSVEPSNLVMVPFAEDIVLQTGDGLEAVDVQLLQDSLGMDWEPQVAQFLVPGRSRPVVRFDVLTDGGSQFRVKVPMEKTPDFKRVLTSGAPIVYRFGAPEGSFDLDPVGVVLVNSVRSEAVPTASLRFWSLGYVPVDDPFADIRLGASPWDDFDAAFSGSAWTALGDMFSGEDWDTFDRQVWADA